MSELYDLFKIEMKKFFSNRKIVLGILLSPLIVAAIIVGIASVAVSSSTSPVHVCAPAKYSDLVTSAGGKLVSSNCEVSFSDPSELYFTLNVYGSTERVRKMEFFASKLENEYFYSLVGTRPTVTRKTVLVIGSKKVFFNDSPSSVMNVLVEIVTGIPVAIFVALLIGNEYVSTYFTSQRDRKLLDLIASYPLRRRNIILSRVLFGVVFGFISVVVLGVGMVLAAVVLAVKYGGGLAGSTSSVSITLPGWSVLLMLIDTFFVVIFTYFVSIVFAMRTTDASETSITSMVVNFVLNFSLLIPSLVGSLGILKYGVVSLAIPTLIPLKVAVLGVEGSVLPSVLYSLYLFVVTVGMYELVLMVFERSFE